MLLDVRTYTCRPGTLNAHMELYARLGLSPQKRCLGDPLAYMTVETGNPNQYMHLGDREAKRAALWADEEWLAYTR